MAVKETKAQLISYVVKIAIAGQRVCSGEGSCGRGGDGARVGVREGKEGLWEEEGSCRSLFRGPEPRPGAASDLSTARNYSGVYLRRDRCSARWISKHLHCS